MDQLQGRKFVENVLTEVWQHFDIERIKDYYAETVQGEINGEVINLQDIYNNAEYHQNYTRSLSSEIAEVVSHGQQIMARAKQTLVTKSGETKVCDVFVNYQLVDGKVVRLYALTYPSYDYKHRDDVLTQ